MALQAAQQPGDKLWDPSWEPASGEATILARKAPRDVQLYCSWFCPFAQRAWIAVEEKGVDYQYCEVNPYEVNPDEPGGYTKRQLPLAEKAAVNGAAFIAASPRGLVPALSHGGKPVWESLPLVEYVDEAFEGAAMMPTDPHERALVRIWSDHATSRMQRTFYTLLMEGTTSTPPRRAELEEAFFKETTALAEAMAPVAEGPFFLGSRFSMVDIALAPFWQRFTWVGGHYLGLTFPETPAFERMADWWAGCQARPSVAATLVCRPRLVSSYSQYFRGLGTSDIAKSIMSNKK